MTADVTLDATDTAILAVVQQDGRITMADLASRVSMSASAVTERVRRLENRGVIVGYAAVVEPAAVGHPILAFVRLRYPSTRYQPLYDLIDGMNQVLEVHHVTGEDCFFIKVAAPSMVALEEITAKIGQLGSISTNVVYSSPVPRRSVTPAS